MTDTFHRVSTQIGEYCNFLPHSSQAIPTSRQIKTGSFAVDDPLDAVAVHFGGGLWGVVSASLFSHAGIVYGANKESALVKLGHLLPSRLLFFLFIQKVGSVACHKPEVTFQKMSRIESYFLCTYRVLTLSASKAPDTDNCGNCPAVTLH